jgi:hypothetical protein
MRELCLSNHNTFEGVVEGSRSDPAARIETVEQGAAERQPSSLQAAGNPNDDLPIGTLKSILRKAEIEVP